MRTQHELVPLLIVQGAASAIDFYARALGARVSARYEHGTERRVSHADLVVAGALRGRIHLVVGPVGAGKSTLALELARDRAALRLTLDDWMTTLFSPDRPATEIVPWYVERAARCVEQIWRVASGAASLGVDVVLEIGLLKRVEREAVYRRVDDAKLPLTIYVIDAARDVRRERVMDRNRAGGATFSMVVPLEIFELASDLWESVGPDECSHREVRFLRTDGR